MFKRMRSSIGILLVFVLAFALLPVQTSAAPVLNKDTLYAAQRATATTDDKALKAFNDSRKFGIDAEYGGAVERTQSFLTDKQRAMIKQQKSLPTDVGLVGFTDEYELKDPNKMVKIIVELVHQPAAVAAAYAALENRPVTYGALENEAKEDKLKFYEDLDRILPMAMNGSTSYDVTADWSTAINGVAVTLPAFAVEELAKSPAVKAIYPDRKVSINETVEESVTENPTTTGGEDKAPSEEGPNENSGEVVDGESKGESNGEADGEPNKKTEEDEISEQPKESQKPSKSSALKTGQGKLVGMDDTRQQLGVDRLHEAGLRGEGVNVLVIDTGVDYNHPDLESVYKGGLNFVQYPQLQRQPDDPMETTYKDWLSIPEGERPPEVDGGAFYTEHGTHVSGSIAATGENTTVSALGVAPKANLYVFRALGPYGSGLSSWIVSSIDAIPEYSASIVGGDGIDVVNMSLGTSLNDPLGPNSIAVNNVMLTNPDMVFCISAGNSGPELRTLGSPGTSPLAITVGNGTTPAIDARYTAESGSKTVVMNKFFTDWLSTFEQDENGSFISTYEHLINENGQMKLVATALDEQNNPAGYGFEYEFSEEVKEAVAGNVAVVLRGNNFYNTMKNAIEAGAGAVLLIQDGPGDPNVLQEYMGPGANYLPMFTISDRQEGLDFFAEAMKDNGYFRITEISNSEGGFLNSSSSRGPVGRTDDIKPDVVGPGTGVLSTVPYYIVDKTLSPDDSASYEYAYQSLTGTSMSSPHIAGVAALMVEYSKLNGDRWNAQEIKARLMSTAKDMSPPSGSGYLEYSVHEIGAGFVDAYRAINKSVKVEIPYSNNVPKNEAGSSFGSGDLSSASFGYYQLGDAFSSTQLDVNLTGLDNTASYYVVAEPNTNAVEVKRPFINYNGTSVPLIPYINNSGTIHTNHTTISSNGSGVLSFKLTNGGDGDTITEDIIKEALKNIDESSIGSYEGYVWIIPTSVATTPENWIQDGILTVPEEYKASAYKIPYSFRFRKAPPVFFLAEAIRPLLPVYGSDNVQIKQMKAGVTSYASDFYWVQGRKLDSMHFLVANENDSYIGELGVGLDTTDIIPEYLYSANQLITGAYYAYGSSDGGSSINPEPTNLPTGLHKIVIAAEYLDADGEPYLDTTQSFPIYVDNAAPYAAKGIDKTVKKSANTWESIYTEKGIRELMELSMQDKATWAAGFYVKDDGLTFMYNNGIEQDLYDNGFGPTLVDNHYIGAVFKVEVDGVTNNKWEMMTALYELGPDIGMGVMSSEKPTEERIPRAYLKPTAQFMDGTNQDNYVIAVNLLEDEIKDRKDVKITIRLIDMMVDTVVSTLAGDKNAYVDAPSSSMYYNMDTWAYYGANMSDEIVINVKYGGLGE